MKDDIHIVWDLKKNEVNDTIYTPSFQLLTPASYHWVVEAGMEAGDFDIGEQFPNYMLHPAERSYFGVDLPEELAEELADEFAQKGWHIGQYMQWNQLPFGWQSSPYFALRMLAQALEIVMQDPRDQTSAFAWVGVQLNLPGMEDYDPGLPRVHQIWHDHLIAAILRSYFDDCQVAGPTRYIAERAL